MKRRSCEIKNIYFYYIVMKIYVLVYINIYSFIYFLCIIIMSQLFFYYGLYTFITINLLKYFFNSFHKSIPFHWYNDFSPQIKVLPKVPKHSFIYLQLKEIKNFLTSYISHDSPYDSICTLICSIIFIMSHHL